MPIRDNRTLLDAADALTNFLQEDGSTMNLTANTSRIQGSGSIAYQVDNTRGGTFFDAGATQNWTDNVFYVWWNCTSANLLRSLADLGVTLRFAAGATPSTNYFEVPIAGSDTYSGGFTMTVMDIEEARNLAVNGSPQYIGGTPPATSAIQYIGIMWDINGMLPGTDPNTFLDAIWRLPVGTPGIIVSAENTLASPNPKPWNWDDIVDAGDVGDTSKAWGTITKDDGVIKLNTPIQFGAAGSPNTDHDFEDTLAVVAWESQLVRDAFYGLTIVGDGVNNSRFVQGVSGSAGQGLTMLAASDGPRWFIDASDVNINTCAFYGCSLSHTEVIDIDNPAVSMFDSLLIDGQRLWHSRADDPASQSPQNGADFQRNAVIAAAPVNYPVSPAEWSPEDDVAYIHTADPDRIIDCDFTYSEGHALRLLESGTYDFVGNDFTGYGDSPGPQAEIHYGKVPSDALPYDRLSDSLSGISSWTLSSMRGNTFFHTGGSVRRVTARMRTVAGSPEVSGDVTARIYSWNPGVGSIALLYESSAVDITTIGTSFENVTFDFTQQSPELVAGTEYFVAFAWFGYNGGGNLQIRFEVVGTLSPQVESGNNFSPEDVIVQGANSEYAYRLEAFDDSPLVLNVSEANTPRVHDPRGYGVTVNNNVSVTITNIQPGTEVRVYPAQNSNSPQDLTEIAGIEETGSPTEFTFTAQAGTLVDIVVLNQGYVLPPANRIRDFEIPATSTSFPISQIIDRNFSNP